MSASDSQQEEQPEKIGSVEFEGGKYELFLKKGDKYAQLYEVKGEDEETFTVPASVNSDGEDYPVLGIAPRALRSSRVEKLVFAQDSQIKDLTKDALYCHTLKRVVLPASIEKLSVGWCNFTLKLVDLTIADGNKTFIVEDKALYNTEKTILYHVARNVKKFVVPSSVETIGSYAFEQCRRLHEIEFPPDSHLQRIDQWAFSHCGLNSIRFPKSLESIGYDAFFHTPRLESISFEDDAVLKQVLIGAFKDTSLHDVVLPPTTTKLGIAAFQNCPKLQSVQILGKGPITVWRDAFSGVSESFRFIVPEGTKVKGTGSNINIDRVQPTTTTREIAADIINTLVGEPQEAEQPPAEEPQAEEPAAEEQPPAEERAVAEPQAEEPAAEEPQAEEPAAEEPVAEEPQAEEPVAEEPQAEEPVAEEPVAEEPAAEEPQAEEQPAPTEEEAKAEPVNGVLTDQVNNVMGALLGAGPLDNEDNTKEEQLSEKIEKEESEKEADNADSNENA